MRSVHKKAGFSALMMMLICLLTAVNAVAQQRIKGEIRDAVTNEPLPFATIKLGNSGQGIIAGLKGEFDLTAPAGTEYIEAYYLGYESKRVALSEMQGVVQIKLSAKEQSLNEVVIRSPEEKIGRILRNAIENRDRNNPEKYDWYRCKIYYKMLADGRYDIADSLIQKDTTGEKLETKKFLDEHYILMSETYSRRTWKRPQKLQEEVLGTRLSGFKKALFTGMVTDILPFHSYNDYLALNGKDYHNPVSRGFFQHFKFDIEDEILQGKDTVWIISFKPEKGYNELAGTVYINSDGYAIAYLVASAHDKSLDREIRLEQQYKKVQGKWFPEQLNYILRYWLVEEKRSGYRITMKGYSKIDSVSYEEEKGFKFDKAHSTRLEGMADELSNAQWEVLRPEKLNEREQRSYRVIDSVLDKVGANKMTRYLEKIVEGKFPVSVFDIHLGRLYSFNQYEGSRPGLGAQTNEKLLKWGSLGGWFGYGTKDHEWKYGGFAEFYLDKTKEFVIKLGYDIDLRDPGRLLINRELDKTYLRRYLMNRVDQVETYRASVKKQLGYWQLELEGKKENIMPRYNYDLYYQGRHHYEFGAKEVSLSWRYAFAERRAPLFGRYYSTGSKYPVWYGKLAAGEMESGAYRTSYVQAVTALQWQKHINRIGNERILVMGGKTFCKDPLPFSKTFAGNGLRYDQSLSFYAFGGMLTMFPYEYYSDDFVSLMWKHDFDWRLFTLSDPKASLSSSPYISIGHNFLYGWMKDRSVHRNVVFSVPDDGYHESGLLLNSLVRLKYFNVYHITLNAGYFYHWTPKWDLKRNGRYLIGLGIDL